MFGPSPDLAGACALLRASNALFWPLGVLHEQDLARLHDPMVPIGLVHHEGKSHVPTQSEIMNLPMGGYLPPGPIPTVYHLTVGMIPWTSNL